MNQAKKPASFWTVGQTDSPSVSPLADAQVARVIGVTAGHAIRIRQLLVKHGVKNVLFVEDGERSE